MTATIHHHGHGILSFCIAMNAICFPASDIARCCESLILFVNLFVLQLNVFLQALGEISPVRIKSFVKR